MLLFQRSDNLFLFDLKSGYHHVDIAESHHKYCISSIRLCAYYFFRGSTATRTIRGRVQIEGEFYYFSLAPAS